MSRRLAWSVTLFVLTGTLVVAQKVVGPEEFDRAMKTIGTAIEGVNQAIGSTSYVDAKTPLALSRQVLASTRPVWEVTQEPDAVRMNREAVATLDALDTALVGDCCRCGSSGRSCRGCDARLRRVSRDVSRR